MAIGVALIPGPLRNGIDTLTITVLKETRTVDGVQVRVLEERETKDGELAEVSRNFFATDKNTGDVYKRTTLPKAWIKAFERFGFDWLGHDMLEDTMHFEFLGDPEKITR